MSNDGAERKVQRLNLLSAFLREKGASGSSASDLQAWAERNLGLAPSTSSGYVRVLERSGEIVFDSQKRKYLHIAALIHAEDGSSIKKH